MLFEYLGLVGLIAAGFVIAFALLALARVLRSKAIASDYSYDAQAPAAVESDVAENKTQPTSRYFYLAVVGLVIHAGSFYFYLWGASVRSAGLSALMVMLGVGMCLMVGVFYSWARGAISYATLQETENRPD
jgi:NADH:ubiquinone oxidoreductase subunit 3 (subunit A)